MLGIADGDRATRDLGCVLDEGKNRRKTRQSLVVARILHRQIVVQT
jgi:hypothetical protein